VIPNITLAVSPTSVSEDGTTNLVYTFTRSGVTTNALTVNYGVACTATLNAVTGTINNDDISILSINNITVVEGKDSNAILTVNVNNPN
jgi:hypothetical protein